MTNLTVAAIKQWFREAVPEPTDKNRAVQIGVHLEEVGEMAEAIVPGCPMSKDLAAAASILKVGPQNEAEATQLAENMKKVNRIELLDALCDQIVTAVGVAHMFGLNIEGALVEVNRSNWSKFVDGKPIFDANGKIAKPASYSKPDLAPFV